MGRLDRPHSGSAGPGAQPRRQMAQTRRGCAVARRFRRINKRVLVTGQFTLPLADNPSAADLRAYAGRSGSHPARRRAFGFSRTLREPSRTAAAAAAVRVDPDDGLRDGRFCVAFRHAEGRNQRHAISHDAHALRATTGRRSTCCSASLRAQKSSGMAFTPRRASGRSTDKQSTRTAC